jgi:2-keto-4-pentenoate hydratase/2-oxohepta-3-ene-1,7-dioic acid hydratase in catechol pathway
MSACTYYIILYKVIIIYASFFWKNETKSSAVLNIMGIDPDEIPFKKGEILIVRYEPETGLLIGKPEKKMDLHQKDKS